MTIGGRTPAKTPNIDEFLKDSVQFSDAYTVAPHCCPSRASLFSGLYPSQHGVWNNVEVDNALSTGLYDGVTLFPERLRDNGYNTVFCGKWHVSAHEGPKDRGFNKVLSEYISNYGRFDRENKPRANDWAQIYNESNKDKICLDSKVGKEFGEIVRPEYPKYYQFGESKDPFDDEMRVELACKEIEEIDVDQPFFMYIGTTGPHDPYYPPQRFIDMYKDVDISLPDSFNDPMQDKPALYRRTRSCFKLTREEHIESLRRYYAFVSFEDYLFGKVIDSLKKKGIYEDTYVLFLSDHGDYIGAHGLWAKGLPCFREAYNIPLAIGGPGFEKGKVVNELVSICDIAPTILEIAGVGGNEMGVGRSLVPLLKGDMVKSWREEIYTQTNGNEIYGIQRAVWNKKWKYVFSTFDYDELYDLENDPQELHNLISEGKPLPPVVKELNKKIWEFARNTGDNCTCPYIMVSLAPYGPGIVLEEDSQK